MNSISSPKNHVSTVSSKCVCGEKPEKCILEPDKDCICGSKPCGGDTKKMKPTSRIPVRVPKKKVCKKCVCNPGSCNAECSEAKTSMYDKPRETCKCVCEGSNCELDCVGINLKPDKYVEEPEVVAAPKKVCQVCKCYSGICPPECLARRQDMLKQNKHISEGKRRNSMKKSDKKVTKCLLGEVCPKCECEPDKCILECRQKKMEDVSEQKPVCDKCECDVDECNILCAGAKKAGGEMPKAGQVEEACEKCDCDVNECNPVCVEINKIVPVEKACEVCDCDADECNPVCVEKLKTPTMVKVPAEDKGELKPMCDKCECDVDECNILCASVIKAGGEMPKAGQAKDACEKCDCDVNECNPVCMEKHQVVPVEVACEKCDCDENECNPVCEEELRKAANDQAPSQQGKMVCVDCVRNPDECKMGCEKQLGKKEEGVKKEGEQPPPVKPTDDVCDCPVGECDPTCKKFQQKQPEKGNPVTKDNFECDCKASGNYVGECDPTCKAFQQKPPRKKCNCTPYCVADSLGGNQANSMGPAQKPAEKAREAPACTKDTSFAPKLGICGICVQADIQPNKPATQTNEPPQCNENTCLPLAQHTDQATSTTQQGKEPPVCKKDTCFKTKLGMCGICVQTDDQTTNPAVQAKEPPECTLDTCLTPTPGAQTPTPRPCTKDTCMLDKNGTREISAQTKNETSPMQHDFNARSKTTSTASKYACNCPTEICRDSSTSKAVNVSSVSARGRNTLAPQARSTTNAICNCGDQSNAVNYVKELEAIMTNIKCTCQKAEQFTQNPYVPTASDIQLVVEMYRKKCKAKDVYIHALIKDLSQRTNNHDFEDLLDDIAKANVSTPDFDATTIANALPRKDKAPQKRSHSCPCERSANVDDLTIVKVRRVGFTSLVVEWTAVKDKNITGYEVYVNGRVKGRVFCRLRTATLLDSLDLKSPLNIEVYALTKNGKCGAPATAKYNPNEKPECNCST